MLFDPKVDVYEMLKRNNGLQIFIPGVPGAPPVPTGTVRVGRGAGPGFDGFFIIIVKQCKYFIMLILFHLVTFCV